MLSVLVFVLEFIAPIRHPSLSHQPGYFSFLRVEPVLIFIHILKAIRARRKNLIYDRALSEADFLFTRLDFKISHLTKPSNISD